MRSIRNKATRLFSLTNAELSGVSTLKKAAVMASSCWAAATIGGAAGVYFADQLADGGLYKTSSELYDSIKIGGLAGMALSAVTTVGFTSIDSCGDNIDVPNLVAATSFSLGVGVMLGGFVALYARSAYAVNALG